MPKSIDIEEKWDSAVMNIAIDTIKIKKQALIFVNTKKSAEKTAEDISKKIKANDANLLKLADQAYNSLPKPTKQCERLAKCLKKGIAFHHAGLTQKQKDLIEDNFRNGHVKIISCTPTLCLSGDSRIWHGVDETEVSKFKNSNRLFALLDNRLINMKSQKVQKIKNSSKLIQISSVSDYSIKVTPNHKMLIRRDGKKMILGACQVKKTDKIATIRRLNIDKTHNPSTNDFIVDSYNNLENHIFDTDLSYFIGLMLADGHYGAQTKNDSIYFKDSPAIVGIDNEVSIHAKKICRKLGLSCRIDKNSHGALQITLSKNKWFRELLVRCCVEKGYKKHLSNRLMIMDLDNSAALLRGLFDADGFVDKRTGPGFSSTSEKFVRQVQKLLLRFGIVSYIRRRKAGAMKIYGKEYGALPSFELMIYQKIAILDFYRYVGFNIKRKSNSLIDLVDRIGSKVHYAECYRCKYKIYRNLFLVSDKIIDEKKSIYCFFKLRNCPLCQSELGWILKKGAIDSDLDGDIFWDKIREIKKVDSEKEVFDVVLSNKPQNDHMFVANGFIVHNSYGLDLPAYRSIIKDLKRFSAHGLSWIPVLDYMQMSGRAGRPNFDKEGQAITIALTKSEKEKIDKKYLSGEPEEIYSKLAVEPVLRTYVLSLIAANFTNSKKDIFEFFDKTFYAHQFKDLRRLHKTITKVIDLLWEWEFIKGPAGDFINADEIEDGKYKATMIGKRVAELYLDPLTAYFMITCMRNGSDKRCEPFSFLQMASHTLEMRPLLRVGIREHDKINEKLMEVSNILLEDEPSLYEVEYEDFLKSIKTALMLNNWIDEHDEEYLLEQYNVRPGELRVKIDIADWLLYATEEIAKIMQFQPLMKQIIKLRLRLKYGVKEELLPLIRLENIGRVRARILYRNKLRDVKDLKNADISTLSQLIGSKTAASVKKQLGQEVKFMPLNKRKGQISLKDY